MQKYVKLNSGIEVPQLGFGVFGIPDGGETEKMCVSALEIGYRRIDTAHIYGNERGVGKAVRESGINRKDITVTTKIWPSEFGEEKTYRAVNNCLDRLGLDYVDIMLLHQQTGDYVGAWKALEKAVGDGRVKSIGISNFESDKRLNRLLSSAAIPPAVHQVECHPYRQQHEMHEKCNKTGTVLESWFPLGHGYPKLFSDERISSIGNKYGKSNAQVILRWHIQEGYMVIPKTTNPEHLRSNFEIFDFELSEEDMAALRELDGEKKFNTMPLFLQGVFNWWQSVTILKDK